MPKTQHVKIMSVTVGVDEDVDGPGKHRHWAVLISDEGTQSRCLKDPETGLWEMVQIAYPATDDQGVMLQDASGLVDMKNLVAVMMGDLKEEGTDGV